MFEAGMDFKLSSDPSWSDYKYAIQFDGKHLVCASSGNGRWRVQLSDEMHYWLESNLAGLTGRFGLKSKEMKLVKTSDDLAGYPFEMGFNDEKVAVHFKLRFGYYPQLVIDAVS